MTDILERLRNYIPGEHEEFVPEINALAAAEIEVLREAVKMARARIEYLGAACRDQRHFDVNAEIFLPRLDRALSGDGK